MKVPADCPLIAEQLRALREELAAANNRIKELEANKSENAGEKSAVMLVGKVVIAIFSIVGGAIAALATLSRYSDHP